MRRTALLVMLLALSVLMAACLGTPPAAPKTYNVSGTAVTSDSQPITNVKVVATPGNKVAYSNEAGAWSLSGLSGSVKITPIHDDYSFDPTERIVSGAAQDLQFVGTKLEDDPDPDTDPDPDPEDPPGPSMLFVGEGKQFTTIQAAVDAADDGDLIVVAPGIYRENVTIEGKRVNLWSQDYWEDGVLPDLDRTVIEAASSDRAVVRVFEPEAKGTEIIGFTIKGSETGIYMDGSTQMSAGTIRYNYVTESVIGILVSNGTYTITENVIFGTGKFGGEGAIELHGSLGMEALIQGNVIKENIGSAVMHLDIPGVPYSVKVIENQISDSAYGIRISVDYGARYEIVDNTIEGNKVGMRLHIVDGELVVEGNQILRNGNPHELRERYPGRQGGGLHLAEPVSKPRTTKRIVITGNQFIGNEASLAGGGLFVDRENGNVHLTNNEFIENSAGAEGGGGIYVNLNGSQLVDEHGVPIVFSEDGTTDSAGNTYSGNIPSGWRLTM